MTQRQAALFGGAAAVLLVVAVAGTASVVARHPEPVQPAATSAVSSDIAQALTRLAETAVPAETAAPTATTSTSPAPRPIGAHAFIAGDLASGEVLASRKSTDVWPQASLTKLMTATVALQEIPAGTPIEIVDVPGGNPSHPTLPKGGVFAFEDVLEVMLVASSNEAAESLAAHVGRERFIAAMNAQAAAWGLDRTEYEDASGLSAGNRTTAREMLAIAQRVYAENPAVFRITRKGSVTAHAQGTGVPYTAYATHGLVRDLGFLGGKTGYTDEARGNLLSLFQVGSRVEALVVLGSDDRFGDTRRLLATLKNP